MIHVPRPPPLHPRQQGTRARAHTCAPGARRPRGEGEGCAWGCKPKKRQKGDEKRKRGKKTTSSSLAHPATPPRLLLTGRRRRRGRGRGGGFVVRLKKKTQVEGKTRRKKRVAATKKGFKVHQHSQGRRVHTFLFAARRAGPPRWEEAPPSAHHDTPLVPLSARASFLASLSAPPKKRHPRDGSQRRTGVQRALARARPARRQRSTGRVVERMSKKQSGEKNGRGRRVGIPMAAHAHQRGTQTRAPTKIKGTT